MSNIYLNMQLPNDEQARYRVLDLLSRYSITKRGEAVSGYIPRAVAATLKHLYSDVEAQTGVDDLDDNCLRCWEPPTVAGYHNHYRLGLDLKSYADRSDKRAVRLSIGKSAEGREIWALRIRPASGNAQKKLLLVGCHHAAEWLSVEVPLLLAMKLASDNSAIFQDVELWVVPMLNPDGHTFSVNCDREWRKSRSHYRNGAAIAAYGVDLNRNYPLGFGTGLTTRDPDTNIFGGVAPFSEPETDCLRRLCLLKAFSGVLSFHAYGNEILFPWGYLPPTQTMRDVVPVRLVAERMGAAIAARGGSYSVLQAYNHYDLGVGGDFCDWVFKSFSNVALTVELGPPDFEMRLPSSMISSVVEDFWPGFVAFIESVQ